MAILKELSSIGYMKNATTILINETQRDEIRKVLNIIINALNMQEHLARKIDLLEIELKGDLRTAGNLLKNHYDDIGVLRRDVEMFFKDSVMISKNGRSICAEKNTDNEAGFRNGI